MHSRDYFLGVWNRLSEAFIWFYYSKVGVLGSRLALNRLLLYGRVTGCYIVAKQTVKLTAHAFCPQMRKTLGEDNALTYDRSCKHVLAKWKSWHDEWPRSENRLLGLAWSVKPSVPRSHYDNNQKRLNLSHSLKSIARLHDWANKTTGKNSMELVLH